MKDFWRGGGALCNPVVVFKQFFNRTIFSWSVKRLRNCCWKQSFIFVSQTRSLVGIKLYRHCSQVLFDCCQRSCEGGSWLFYLWRWYLKPGWSYKMPQHDGRLSLHKWWGTKTPKPGTLWEMLHFSLQPVVTGIAPIHGPSFSSWFTSFSVAFSLFSPISYFASMIMFAFNKDLLYLTNPKWTWVWMSPGVTMHHMFPYFGPHPMGAKFCSVALQPVTYSQCLHLEDNPWESSSVALSCSPPCCPHLDAISFC